MPATNTIGDPMSTIDVDTREMPERAEDGIDDFDDRVPN